MKSIEIQKIKKAADYIRYLTLETIEKTQSGHPGLPLGCSDIGVVLYRYILKHYPENPEWINRDRFVLSAGHGSMLLYSLLYLSGYNISLEDVEKFRQLGSKTPGHPEYNIKNGIETTTGPLAQGFSNSVGMAIEGKMLAEKFNKKGYAIFDYTIYTLLGDGCNMEGLSYESASLAGHLGLDNLIAIYDSNNISIDGSTNITFTENVAKRYEALGWKVDFCDATGSVESFFEKIDNLKKIEGKPKILITKTIIGNGLNKKKNTNKIHGSAAGIDEIVYFIQNSETKNIFEKKYGKESIQNREKLKEITQARVENKESLLQNKEVVLFMKQSIEDNRLTYNKWVELNLKYKKAFPKEYIKLKQFLNPSINDSIREKLLNYMENKPDSTRNIAGRVLNLCAVQIPQIIGGSADLASSTKANLLSSKYIEKKDFSGRNIAYGIREHAMCSINNGLALNHTMIPFSSTFLTFFDYMKPGVRLAALMKLNHIFIFSHDSIYIGEDGPTHQPIEHVNSLRLIPDIYTFRPANDIETAFSFLYFLEDLNGPIAIITTRQSVMKEAYNDSFERSKLYENFRNGAYIFYETRGLKKPDIIIGASGSELGVSYKTAKLIEEKDNLMVRVISIPCLELFSKSDKTYKDFLLFNKEATFVFIEAGSHRGVDLFYDRNMILIDIQHFGASASSKELQKEYGMLCEDIYDKIRKIIH